MKNNSILLRNTQLQQSQIAELSLLQEDELNEVTGGDKKKEGGGVPEGYSWYCFNIGCAKKDPECKSQCPPSYFQD